MSAFSENLRRIRFEHGMTQEEFAEMLGTTKQNISRYESGAVSPKINTAAAIAEKLGITLSELNGTKDSNEANTAEPRQPISKEHRMLSKGFEELETKRPRDYRMLVNMIFKTYPEFFGERNDANDPES